MKKISYKIIDNNRSITVCGYDFSQEWLCFTTS